MAGRGKGGKGLGKGGGMVTLVCIYVCVMCLKKNEECLSSVCEMREEEEGDVCVSLCVMGGYCSLSLSLSSCVRE